MTKHYIRINENGDVIHGFSDKFEKPIQGDLCINENASRHFPMQELFPKGINTDEGYPQYKWDDKKMSPIEKKIVDVYTLDVKKNEKKLKIATDRSQAEYLFRILKPFIDGKDPETIESDLLSLVDAAKTEAELEAIKWG